MNPDNSKPPGKPAHGSFYDALLDPLPLPDVVESDSETAWGRWEDSLQTYEPTSPAALEDESDFQSTQPMDLDHIPGLTDPQHPKNRW